MDWRKELEALRNVTAVLVSATPSTALDATICRPRSGRRSGGCKQAMEADALRAPPNLRYEPPNNSLSARSQNSTSLPMGRPASCQR